MTKEPRIKSKRIFVSLLLIATLLLTPILGSDIYANDLTEKQRIDSYIEIVSSEYAICPELVMAIVETESGYDPYARNGSCSGLMQVSTYWHKGRMQSLGVTNIFDEQSNILVGVDYLSELLEQYDEPLALMVYNMGYTTAYSYYKNGTISSYAKNILVRKKELQFEHALSFIKGATEWEAEDPPCLQRSGKTVS